MLFPPLRGSAGPLLQLILKGISKKGILDSFEKTLIKFFFFSDTVRSILDIFGI